MSDMDDDDDLSRFLEEDDDKLKPIDIGGGDPPKPSVPEFDAADLADSDKEKAENTSPAPDTDKDKEQSSEGLSGAVKTGVPPFPDSDVATDDIPKPVFGDAPTPTNDVLLSDDLMSDIEMESERREDLKNDGKNKRNRGEKHVPLSAEEVTSKMAVPDIDTDTVDDRGEMPEHLKEHQTKINYIKRGDYVDLKEKRPGLANIVLGAGWDQRGFEEQPLDLDLSIFLLNKEETTRDDGDFVFYNNTKACEGAVRHNFDSRTGAGDGDDETIDLDLNGIPFDVLKIAVVISIYDPNFDGHHFGKVKNIYVRIVDKSDGLELFRYKLEDEHVDKGNALIVGMLIREGPKWIFEANSTETINGGLAKYATDYDIIVKELQSTGIDEDGATERSDD